MSTMCKLCQLPAPLRLFVFSCVCVCMHLFFLVSLLAFAGTLYGCFALSVHLNNYNADQKKSLCYFRSLIMLVGFWRWFLFCFHFVREIKNILCLFRRHGHWRISKDIKQLELIANFSSFFSFFRFNMWTMSAPLRALLWQCEQLKYAFKSREFEWKTR